MRYMLALLALCSSIHADDVFKPTGRYAVTTEPAGDTQHQSSSQIVTVVAAPVRYIQWQGWGQIDLATYSRACNCNMCRSIRSKQVAYREQLAAYNAQQAAVSVAPQSIAASQESTPDAVVDQIVSELKLKTEDTLCDMGAGDGRILIAAVKRYRCNAVGVEIEPGIGETARRRVKAAGLSHRITIITGDALQFDPDQHGVTAITAYLYPELLKQLLPKFKHDRIMVVATPYHEVPGLTMTRHGEVFVWRRKVKRRQQFLVSESWCHACPAAKQRFRALGWPEANILTIAECRQRFGFSVPHVPYLFDDPNGE